MSDPRPLSEITAEVREKRLARIPCPQAGCTRKFGTAVMAHADGRGATAPCPTCRGMGTIADPAFDVLLAELSGRLDGAIVLADRRAIASADNSLMHAESWFRRNGHEGLADVIKLVRDDIAALLCGRPGKETE